MLTRLKSLTSDLPLHAAHCFDRYIATQLCTFFCCLGGIAKVPWKHFLGGTLPAFITASLSFLAFIYKARPVSANAELLQKNLCDMTKNILLFLRHSAVSSPYLDSLKLTPSEKNLILNEADENQLDDFLPLLQKMFHAIENQHWCLAVNLWDSTIHCLSHFSEMLLLRNYAGFEPLHDPELSNANILTLALMVFAAYSGYHHFHLRQEKNKNPSAHLLCKTLIRDYDDYVKKNAMGEASERSYLLNTPVAFKTYVTF